MRPEILNPLFAEVEVLKGVEPQISKLLKKLALTRVVDVLYHLPTGAIERVRARARGAGTRARASRMDRTGAGAARGLAHVARSTCRSASRAWCRRCTPAARL